MEFNNGKQTLQGIGNGFNIAQMMAGATSGKNGGQRAANIVPIIAAML